MERLNRTGQQAKYLACFVIGHRPRRFQFPESSPKCQKIKDAIAEEIERLYDNQGIRGVWVGGAMGVDTWAAEIVLELQKQPAYQDIALYVAIPFPEHGADFPEKQKERYRRIIKECTDSVVVGRAFYPDSYKRRDYYMVDHSYCGIAVYDQNRAIRSGTGMTVNYATKRKTIPMTFIHPDTAAISRLMPEVES